MQKGTMMLFSRRFRREAAALTAVAFGAATLMAHAPEARADEVSPTGKGIVGGALLGGEVVMITESLFRVENGWAYVIGGGLGAVGGGIGGYFVEQGSIDGRAPIYMLAGGLALIIPTLVLTLNATRYHPTEGASEDRAPTNGPAADPGKAGGSVIVGPSAAPASPAPAVASPPAAPQSLLDIWAPGNLGPIRR